MPRQTSIGVSVAVAIAVTAQSGSDSCPDACSSSVTAFDTGSNSSSNVPADSLTMAEAAKSWVTAEDCWLGDWQSSSEGHRGERELDECEGVMHLD